MVQKDPPNSQVLLYRILEISSDILMQISEFNFSAKFKKEREGFKRNKKVSKEREKGAFIVISKYNPL